MIQLLLKGPLLDCGPARPFGHARLEAVIIRRKHGHDLEGRRREAPPTQKPPARTLPGHRDERLSGPVGNELRVVRELPVSIQRSLSPSVSWLAMAYSWGGPTSSLS